MYVSGDHFRHVILNSGWHFGSDGNPELCNVELEDMAKKQMFHFIWDKVIYAVYARESSTGTVIMLVKSLPSSFR